MLQVRWTSKALEAFEAALAFLAADNPANAVLVRTRILHTVSLLESFSLGSPAPKGYSKLYVPKTPYLIIFSRDDLNQITILSLFHASRDWEQIDWDKI
jgi:toxin ParE1/3/4